MPRTGRPPIKIPTRKALALYNERGLTLTATADKLGVNILTLRRLMHRLAVPVRSAAASRKITFPLDARDAHLIEAHQRGKTLRELGKMFGLTHQRVHQIVSGGVSAKSKALTRGSKKRVKA